MAKRSNDGRYSFHAWRHHRFPVRMCYILRSDIEAMTNGSDHDNSHPTALHPSEPATITPPTIEPSLEGTLIGKLRLLMRELGLNDHSPAQFISKLQKVDLMLKHRHELDWDKI